MNNSALLKRMGFQFLGGVIGAVIGYFIAEQLFKEEEYEEIQQAPLKVDDGRFTPDIEPESTPPQEIVDYNRIANQYLRTGKDSEEIEARKSRLTEEKPKIYIITFEQYLNEHATDYEKASLTYYAGDGAVIDDQDTPATDAIGEAFRAGPVGLDIETRKTEDGVIYVRNDRIAKDFEITRVERPYMMSQTPEDFPEEHIDVEKAKREIRRSRRSKRNANLENGN